MTDAKIRLIMYTLLKEISFLFDVVSLSDISDRNFDVITDTAAYIAADLKEESTKKSICALKSVFNVLNGEHGDFGYACSVSESLFNFPIEYERAIKSFKESFSSNEVESFLAGFDVSTMSEDTVNALLNALEKDFSDVSCFSSDDLKDISFFDYLKMTAALACCIFDYSECAENVVVSDVASFCNEDAFILYSMDFSGIQDFIYTIQSKGAMKTLRARSFYLEIMMEDIIEELLDKLGLSITNLIYSGGGHCYLILPNTDNTVRILKDFNREVNGWLLEKFNISLYVAHGYSVCSGNSLNNKPSGSYSDIFRNVSSEISKQKANRYSAKEILAMNAVEKEDYSRECSVCKRLDKLNAENECSICSSIKDFSRNILNDKLFIVVDERERSGVPMPFGCNLIALDDSMESLKSIPEYKRVYGKNYYPDILPKSRKMAVGSYSSNRTFEQMADDAERKGLVNRIGIVRADIDNLGTAFVSGFENKKNGDKYVNILRTSALSSKLSCFFKVDIGKILNDSDYSLSSSDKHQNRNATICYSGGDDLFIVGEWDEVIELTVDIRNAFKKYTLGALTFSAGIGVYGSSYPISRMAVETAVSEDKSKKLIGKDGITLLEDGVYHTVNDDEGHSILISDGTFKWEEFLTEVLEDKYQVIKSYFDCSAERGMSFLYKLLELIRNQEEKINFARYVYLLARLEPTSYSSKEEKELYKDFSSKMISWVKNAKDCRQLKTAINLYAYMNRNNKEA